MSDISIPTQAGIQWNAQAAAGQNVLPITEIAFGTSDRIPNSNETSLGDEVFRQTISDFGTRDNDTQAFFQVPLIGADQTFTFQEIGLFLSDGTMVGVARRAAPQLVGPLDAYTYEFIIAYSSLEALVVEVDPIHGIAANRRIDTDGESGLVGGGDFSQNRTHSILKASEGQRGTLKIATLAQALLGVSTDTVVTPATLFAATGKTADGLPLFLSLSNSGQTLQNVPPLVNTLCTNLVVGGGNVPQLWNGSRFTVDAGSLGVYGIFNQLNIGGENGESALTYKNGVLHSSYAFGETAGNSNVVGFTSFVNLIDVGDYVEFYHFHRSPGTRQNSQSTVQLYRLFPYIPPVGE